MECFVPTCNNRSDVQNWEGGSNVMKITFHCFPNDSDACSVWLDLLGIRDSEIPKTANICSVHFEETSFYTEGSSVRLRPNALPRKIIKEEFCIESSCIEFCENNMDTTLLPNPTQGLIPKIERVESIAGTSSSFGDYPLSPELSTPNKDDRGTMVSPKFVYNSPEKLRLRKRVQFVEADSRKKLFQTRRQLQRIAKQVVQLKNVIEDLTLSLRVPDISDTHTTTCENERRIYPASTRQPVIRCQSRTTDNPNRLSERHFPSVYIPKGKNRSRRCVVCSKNDKRSESRYECKNCNVGLCVDPCFRIYHTVSTY